VPLTDAVILAAGMGTRLRNVLEDRPKGLIEIDGETLVGRSLGLLRAAGIQRITIVAGFRADLYVQFAAGHHDVQVLLNREFEHTGSMASLEIALAQLPQRDVLVLESDIVYEARALRILSEPHANATLVSGPTAAGDEVWVCAENDRLVAMSKARAELRDAIGEFVGITRLSAAAADAMCRAFHSFVAANGHGRMDYETGALVTVAQHCAVRTLVIDDLCWGEIDDERHYARMIREVWPTVVARDRVQ
jgi:2-aminoethylphosphonate-pyruvate transaminase